MKLAATVGIVVALTVVVVLILLIFVIHPWATSSSNQSTGPPPPPSPINVTSVALYVNGAFVIDQGGFAAGEDSSFLYYVALGGSPEQCVNVTQLTISPTMFSIQMEHGSMFCSPYSAIPTIIHTPLSSYYGQASISYDVS